MDPVVDLATCYLVVAGAAVLAMSVMRGRPAKKPSPDDALRALQEGNRRFVTGKAAHPRTDFARLQQAGTEDQGDHAFATVIACSDSRVPVERIFDAGVMDIFVIRVAGNVCNADEIGSMEYGLVHVRTPLLVILGHTQCGAVTAVSRAVQGDRPALERNIPGLIEPIKEAVHRALASNRDRSEDSIVASAVKENVWIGIERVFMESPAIRDLVKSRAAKVVGALYDVKTGQVSWLPQRRVAEILASVEAHPGRALDPMAPET